MLKISLLHSGSPIPAQLHSACFGMKRAMNGEVRDNENPLFIFSLTDTKILQQIASGKLDVIQLAMLELEARHPHLKTYSIYGNNGKRIKCTIPD